MEISQFFSFSPSIFVAIYQFNKLKSIFDLNKIVGMAGILLFEIENSKVLSILCTIYVLCVFDFFYPKLPFQYYYSLPYLYIQRIMTIWFLLENFFSHIFPAQSGNEKYWNLMLWINLNFAVNRVGFLDRFCALCSSGNIWWKYSFVCINQFWNF